MPNNTPAAAVGCYSLGEEIANSVTHGVAALLSIAGLVVMLCMMPVSAGASTITAAAVFGASMIFLYTASTLYHAIPNIRVKRILQVLDHSAIYVMIAGSYTPFCLVTLKGETGTMLCIAVWSIALAGIILQPVLMKRARMAQLPALSAAGLVRRAGFRASHGGAPDDGHLASGGGRHRLLARRRLLPVGADSVQPCHLAPLRAGRHRASVLFRALLRAAGGRFLRPPTPGVVGRTGKRERGRKKTHSASECVFRQDPTFRLGHGLDGSGETALVAGGGVRVENALAGHGVDHGFGLLEGFLSGGLVAGDDELAHGLDGGAELAR